MKKRFTLLLILALTTILLAACYGDKEVTDIKITSGLKNEYKIGESLDFSEVTATVYFNDGTSESVSAPSLKFSDLDTTTAGVKQLTISYLNFSTTIRVHISGESYDHNNTDRVITAVSLPESLVFWESNKQDFINKNQAYVVGDDNPFIFTLRLSVYSLDGEKLNITSYKSASSVWLADSSAPLSDSELTRYVTIDEEKNSFDFTEEAIGKTFTIYTRPSDGVDGYEAEMTKSLNVTVVDGYNIYEAYELNYITNTSSGLDFTELHSNDPRNQVQIVDDFLANEKLTSRPKNLSAVILHNNMTIEREDIPREYFLDKNRQNDLYDLIYIFNNDTSNELKSFSIHGNYFAIYSHNLPSVVAYGTGNQDNSVSNSTLFNFSCSAEDDLYFNHKEYSANINNIMLVDNEPQSDNIDAGKKSMLGLIAIKTQNQVSNLNNVKIDSFLISMLAEYDYQTINLNECIFENSWQNHLHLVSANGMQDNDDEPLPKSEYPRLTLNIKKSHITQSGGPAIIMQTNDPGANKNKNSGPAVNISEDSKVESWVSGDEAWFESLGIAFIAQWIKNYEKNVQALDSSFIKEEVRNVNGKPTTFKLVNIIAVNLLVPDLSLDVMGMFGQIQGKTDIDGVLTIGHNTAIGMDDHIYNGVTSSFENPTVSALKNESTENHVFTNTSGGVGCLGSNRPFSVVEGDLSASSDNDLLTIYFYSMAILLGNYHSIR